MVAMDGTKPEWPDLELLVLLHDAGAPALDIVCCFPRHISMELGRK